MSDLDAALAAIWDRSKPLIRTRLEVVERSVAAALDGGADAPALEAGRGAAHQLAGSLGTFGIAEGSDLAREIEAQLAGDATRDDERLRALSVRLRALLDPRLR
jgi:HPt (histidine-containing phosphotransfer) domain-containing protein